ncbi:MAG: phenylalanine--tRNA ligase subunit beta [Actinomycetota bacterium]|nr:phenylalanine--tRNA ligase subunit beta [Actinomycetota bacterium]
MNLRWLEDYVHVDVPVRKLMELLNNSGLKVDAVHGGREANGVVVAEVVDTRPHPNSDTLTLVDVKTDPSTTHHVVCGVRNYSVGDRVPLATVGSRLGDIDVAERKIRGEISQGMLCSPAELNISRDHTGIFILPADAPLGEDLTTLLDLDATVIELEVSSNRGDCMGMIGLAREVAALLGNELRTPPTEIDVDPAVPNPVSVDVRAPEGCPRYVARYMEGVRITNSPLKIVKRLLSAGVRPVSNVVDVTNYVMLETGQPLHAFDAARVKDTSINVRHPGAGESMTTLDGVERELHPDDLLIADPRGPLAMAGLMGGAHSEVSDDTTSIILESACFDPATIAYMSRRHVLRTDASARFERGTDPEGVKYAAARAARLMTEAAGARVGADVTDAYPAPVEPRRITLRTKRTDALMGASVRADLQAAKLRSIQLDVTEGDRTLDVGIPTFRRDLKREVDLVEEVARLVGFERLPSTLPPGRGGGLNAKQKAERRLKATLIGLGATEAWTPAFMGRGDLDALGLPADHAARRVVAIANPMTEDETGLRTTLLPGVLRSVARNVARRTESVALFELARIYEPSDGALPQEAEILTGAFTGERAPKRWNRGPAAWDFFAVKGIVEALLNAVGAPAPSFSPVSGAPFHLTRAARVELGDRVVGALGDVHPDVCASFDVPEGTVAFEIALAPVYAALSGRARGQELPKFPPMLIDLAVIVREETPAENVEVVIAELGTPEVTSVRLFDLYGGDQVPAGHKSLAFALELRSPDKTLTDEDAVRVRDRIMSGLAERVGARLRT